MKGKIESLEEKIICMDREFTKDSFPYCRINNKSCPFIEKERYVILQTGSYHPCNYFVIFDNVGDRKDK